MHFMIKRRLNDYDAWKKVISELDGLRAQYGSRGFTSYRNADDPSEVYLIFEWDDTRPPEAYLRTGPHGGYRLRRASH